MRCEDLKDGLAHSKLICVCSFSQLKFKSFHEKSNNLVLSFVGNCLFIANALERLMISPVSMLPLGSAFHSRVLNC